MWRRTLSFGPAWLLHPIYVAARRFPRLRLTPIEWDERHVDLRTLDGTRPHLAFTQGELARGRQLLVDLSLDPDRPYVCLAVRDSAYLSSLDPERDWSYHDYRDADVSTYTELAETLVNAGYQVLRMGSVVRSAFDTTLPGIVDYARSPYRSEFGDVFLFAHCDFCITNSTGMDSVAMAFRRPLGLANLAVVGGLQLGRGLKLVMFKDVVDSTSGESLSRTSDLRRRAMSIHRAADLGAMGVDLQPNSSQQLQAFAIEMIECVSGTLDLDLEHAAREREFVRFITQGDEFTEADFHISPTWLSSLPDG